MTIKYRNPVHTALFLVVVGICAALHIWKLPPALPLLQKEFILDLVESGFLLSSVQIAGMLLGLITGLFAERIGLRRCILIGLSILVLASLSAVLFHSKTMLLFSRAIEGAGFLMVVLPIPALIKRLVPAEILSRIMGFWACYMAVGAVIILFGGSWLLSLDVSWRMLWLLLAAITAFVFLLSFILIPRESATVATVGADSTIKPEARLSISDMVFITLRSGRVWIVALTFSVYAAQWSAVIGFLPTIYASAGISGLSAGFLTALVAGSNIIGNLSGGRLLYKGISAKKLLIVGFVTMMVSAFVAFGLDVGAGVQFFAILLFSIVGGLIPATLFLLGVTFAPTPQTTASTVGWVQQGSSMGQFLGAPAVAWVVSLLGGWQWAWIATAGFALFGIAMVLMLPKTVTK